MKKLILVGVVGFLSLSTYANQPLFLNSGSPQVIGTSPNYISTSSDVASSNAMRPGFSVKGGYSGLKIDSDLLGKGRFNGFELGATYDLDRRGVWTKLEIQEDNTFDVDQFSLGGHYTFFNNKQTYMQGSLGLGYAWSEVKGNGASVDLDYIFLPVGVEVGYYFTQNLAAYAGLGYKWFSNENAEACIDGECVSGDSRDLDVHGESYNFGLKYKF